MKHSYQQGTQSRSCWRWAELVHRLEMCTTPTDTYRPLFYTWHNWIIYYLVFVYLYLFAVYKAQAQCSLSSFRVNAVHLVGFVGQSVCICDRAAAWEISFRLAYIFPTFYSLPQFIAFLSEFSVRIESGRISKAFRARTYGNDSGLFTNCRLYQFTLLLLWCCFPVSDPLQCSAFEVVYSN